MDITQPEGTAQGSRKVSVAARLNLSRESEILPDETVEDEWVRNRGAKSATWFWRNARDELLKEGKIR
jgi:hypothetical protein